MVNIRRKTVWNSAFLTHCQPETSYTVGFSLYFQLVVIELPLTCSFVFLSNAKEELFNTVISKTFSVAHVLHVKAYSWARGVSIGKSACLM